MTQQQLEMQSTIQTMAEEQVLFLQSHYKMNPQEIINLYTGEQCETATFGDAIRSIMLFNAQNANLSGFVSNS